MPFKYRQIIQSGATGLRNVGRITAKISVEVGAFIILHRETAVGGAAGYLIGRLLESIPFVGPLLSPLASTVLGIGGGAAGYRRELDRRRCEAFERAQRQHASAGEPFCP